MTGATGSTTSDSPARPGSPQAPPGSTAAPAKRLRGRTTPRPLVVLAGPVILLAAVVYSIGLANPGIWRDEGATIVACRRTLPELFRLTSHIDLVHLTYYLIAHTVWSIEPSVAAVRSISVVAMSLTAGVMVAIGRRLGTPGLRSPVPGSGTQASDRLGLLAGLLFVAVPFTTRFGQEARSFALVTLVATVLTYALLGLLQSETTPARPPPAETTPAETTPAETTPVRTRALVTYALGVLLLGLLNVLALLLLVVHAVVVLAVAGPRLRRTWLLTAVPALMVLAPFAVFALGQRSQISWMVRPSVTEPYRLASYDFGGLLAPVLIVLALAVTLAAVRTLDLPWLPWLPEGASRNAVLLGAAWGLLPPLLLWTGSQIIPMSDYHYLLFSLPGLVLLIAGLVPGVTTPGIVRSSSLQSKALPIVLAVLVVAAIGLPQQIDDRRSDGHWGENLTLVADYIAPRARPGDAVVFVPSELRVIEEDYPEAFARLDDATLLVNPIRSGTLDGVSVAAGSIEARLAPYRRVWLVRGAFLQEDELPLYDRTSEGVLARDYTVQSTARLSDVDVSLVVRKPA